METQQNSDRDFSAISPSAKSLLLLKGLTNIPYARDMASLISFPEKYNPDLNNKDLAYWKRVVHFEIRYWSIDQLLAPLHINNILELSSGFSFRGLATINQKMVHYVDTDLPNITSEKRALLQSLSQNDQDKKGRLEMLPLNVLDEAQFHEIVGAFPEGPLVVVNEGLLMYLNQSEKERLCKTIHDVLQQRGGYWITGDVYVKSTLERLSTVENDSLKELLDQQRIEENMFESFEAAEAFFKRNGFVIDKEAETDLSKISSLQYLMANATEAQLKEMQASSKKIQATWRLKIESVD